MGPTDQRGSSTVELALLAPLLAALLLYGMHLSELGHVRIRQQEITRYAAWELTARSIGDLDDARHGQRFARAASEVAEEARRRYRDLSGHERAERDLVGAATRVRLTGLDIRPAKLASGGEVKRGGGGHLLDGVLGVIGTGLDAALAKLFRFNVDHAAADVSVRLEVENTLFPAAGAGPLLGGRLLPDGLRRVALASSTHLAFDGLHASDGRDVHLPGGDGGKGYRFWKQVQRMHLLRGALGEILGPFEVALDAVEKYLPGRFITEAQLVAQNYTEAESDPSRMQCRSRQPLVVTGAWRNGGAFDGPTGKDGMSAQACFDTLPLLAAGTGKRYEDDPSFLLLQARSSRYMGCKRDGRNPKAGKETCP